MFISQERSRKKILWISLLPLTAFRGFTAPSIFQTRASYKDEAIERTSIHPPTPPPHHASRPKVQVNVPCAISLVLPSLTNRLDGQTRLHSYSFAFEYFQRPRKARRAPDGKRAAEMRSRGCSPRECGPTVGTENSHYLFYCLMMNTCND